jgi:phosphoglycerol geranylgeranyltransferase
MIYDTLLKPKKKMLALLIDPEQTRCCDVPVLLDHSNQAGVSLVLVGGSLVNSPFDCLIDTIRKYTSAKVLLFPGNPGQLNDRADGLLLLSLISGRNPEFLIGNHVIAARFLRNSSLEIIPAGYMLVENGGVSSAEYISNTKPLPRDKPDIAVSTAIAGELLGLKVIYLEGGSGARGIIPPAMIRAVRESISIPLIVGGGIRNAADLRSVFDAGADIAVIGNAAEHNPGIFKDLAKEINGRE